MYKFIQRNQKKMLAIFSVGLMIVFILPQTMKSRHPSQEAVFHLGKEAVTVGEVRQAAADWRVIRQFMPRAAMQVQFYTGDIERNPDAFLLLIKEAQQLGLRASESQVNDVVTAIATNLSMQGQAVPANVDLRSGVASMILVNDLFQRVESSLKTSGPAAVHALAENYQRVKLNLVHYAVDDFRKDVAAPTDEQLKKQFEDFKNTPPGNPGQGNPFGFGYLIPAQVQLAYLTVPRDEVARAIRHTKPEIDWETDAVPVYKADPWKHYPGGKPKPPAAPSTTQSTTQPATEPVAANWNSLSPAGKEPYIQDVMKPAVDARIEEIATAVNDRMSADFTAHQKMSFGAPNDFQSRAYLDRIAADIEKRFGVKLGVSEINDPKDERGLGEIKGIGQASAGDQPFPSYVFRWAEPLVPAVQKTSADVLKIGQPSRRFHDAAGNVYIAQLRDAKPAHPPADLNAVKDKVDADLRTKLAYDAALAAAKKLHDAAGAKGLAEAAKAANKDVFESPAFFDNRGNADASPAVLIPHVNLAPSARQTMVAGAFELLAKASPEKPHPTSLIEMPAAGRIVVAELGDVERIWPDDQQQLAELDAARELTIRRAPQVMSQYFSFDALKQRLQYSNPNEKLQTAAAE
jgi:hypothetical protein